ncbi:MAG: hypothetical protein AAF519_15250, partial [Bacteroidota bacterium]
MRKFVLLLLSIISTTLNSQNLVTLTKLPEILAGCSGIEFSDQGDLMMINDHGNPFLYFIDTSSYRIKKTIYLNNQIKDWEDITLSDNEDI